MSSKIASWRAPGSILEGLGLDLGGSGPRFWRLQASIFEPPGQHAPEKLFFRKFPALSAFPPPFLPSPTAWQSSNIPATRGGGGGGPPWGVSIRRPPKVCQRRARLISNWLCPITAGQSRHSFEQFVRAIRSEVFFPLSFPFPRSLGTTANPKPKSGKVCFFRIFSRFFCFPNRARKTTSKKHRKKTKIEDFGLPNPSPNPPKILSKSRSPKTCDFASIFG